MNDTRFMWVKHLSYNPSKVIIVVPSRTGADSLRTLVARWKGLHQPKVIETNFKVASFTPLNQSLIEKIDCDTIVYLINSRESYISVKDKLIAQKQLDVAEYCIFPGVNNPRWFVPTWRTLGRGKMSRMIQPTTLIARIAVLVFRSLKLLGCEHLIFKSRLVVATKIKNKYTPSLINLFQGSSHGLQAGIIYTGSYGPLQKFTVELIRDNEVPFAYAKFGNNVHTREAIVNEKAILNKLNKFSLRTVKFPKLIEFDLPHEFDKQALIIKRLEGGYPLTCVTKPLLKGLVELYEFTNKTNATTVRSYIVKLIESLKFQDCTNLDEDFGKMRDDVVSILQNILLNYNDNSHELSLALSHGDFTRWNVRADNESIYAIDWEEGAMRLPGYDLLSFLVAEYLLVPQSIVIKNVSSLIMKEIYNGHFSYFIKALNLAGYTINIDNSLLAVFFFSEVLRSNLWHIRMHHEGRYPPKPSLDNHVKLAWICCVKIYKQM